MSALYSSAVRINFMPFTIQYSVTRAGRNAVERSLLWVEMTHEFPSNYSGVYAGKEIRFAENPRTRSLSLSPSYWSFLAQRKLGENKRNLATCGLLKPRRILAKGVCFTQTRFSEKSEIIQYLIVR